MKIIKTILVAGVAFYMIAKVTIAFGDYELRRYHLPGFWHTLRGHPLVLTGQNEDVSVLPVSEKFGKIWEFIKRQDT